ncbi:PPC domain-containing DNA-binding protein [Actinosynnema sp. NPDC051121]
MLSIRVSPGEEVLETVTRRLAEAGVRDGAIVSVIGGVDHCAISYMPKSDARRDVVVEYAEPLEVTGTGAVTDGTPHIHLVAGREHNEAVAGHLHWARVGTWFVDVFVLPASTA